VCSNLPRPTGHTVTFAPRLSAHPRLLPPDTPPHTHTHTHTRTRTRTHTHTRTPPTQKQSPGDVTLRACAFSTDTGLGAFATLPLAREVSGQRAALGVRYSSPQFTAGAVVQPAANVLSSVWACARSQGMTRECAVCVCVRASCVLREEAPQRRRWLVGAATRPRPRLLARHSHVYRLRVIPPPTPTADAMRGAMRGAVGVQVRPGLTMHDLPGSLQAATAGSSGSSGGSGGGCGGGGDFASWLRGVTSVALSYSPEGRTRAGVCVCACVCVCVCLCVCVCVCGVCVCDVALSRLPRGEQSP
jgi:hypothetical protein